MTFGLVSENKKTVKKYRDAPRKNEPHVIHLMFRDGSSAMMLAHRDYPSANHDAHYIYMLGGVNGRDVKDLQIIPVKDIQEVFPELTPKMVLARGFIPESERPVYQYQKLLHEGTIKIAPKKRSTAKRRN